MSTTLTSTRANLGPLTTTWSAPSLCQSAWQACSTCADAWQAQDCQSDGLNMDALSCWPSITSTRTTFSVPFNGLGFYSPGLACPVGYETACAMEGASNGLQQTISGQQQFEFQFAPIADETAVGCCPSGYACASNNFQTCTKQIASTTQPLLTCVTGPSTVITQIILPETVTTTASSSVVGTSTITDFVIYAPLWQLIYKAADLPASSTLTTSSTTAIEASSSTTATEALSSNTTSAGSGNSHTTTIAVAVTVPVVVIALLAATLGWWFWRKRARSARNSYAPPPAANDGPSYSPVELSSPNVLLEMPSPTNPVPAVEMPHDSSVPKPPFLSATVHEMDG